MPPIKEENVYKRLGKREGLYEQVEKTMSASASEGWQVYEEPLVYEDLPVYEDPPVEDLQDNDVDVEQEQEEQEEQEEKEEKEERVPDGFGSVIGDFARDLLLVFPEKRALLERWTTADTISLGKLYRYCRKVYPERFLDILNQNADCPAATFFPGLDFRELLHTPGLSEASITAIWKYLQLVLLTVVGSIHDKQLLGSSAKMLEDIDANELQGKLQDTMTSIQSFFQNLPSQQDDPGPTKDHVKALHGVNDHLQGLLQGKMGALAKELAAEMSGDLMDLFQGGDQQPQTTGDVLQQLLQHPDRIKQLMQTISGKLEAKMQDGSLDEQDIFSEMQGFMKHMQGMSSLLGVGAGSGGAGAGGNNMLASLMSLLQPGAKKTTGRRGGAGPSRLQQDRMRRKWAKAKETKETKEHETKEKKEKEAKEERVFRVAGDAVQPKSFR